MTPAPSSTAKTVQPEAIDLAADALKALPPKPKPVPIREAIVRLHTLILTARNDGYSDEEICQVLGAQGVEIAPQGLRYHLARTGPSAAQAEKTPPPKTVTKAKPPEASSVKAAALPILAAPAEPEIPAPPAAPTPEPASLPAPEGGTAKKGRGKTSAPSAGASIPGVQPSPKKPATPAPGPAASPLAPASPAKTVGFSMLAIPFQVPYNQALSISGALKTLFQQHKGKELATDQIIEFLYGELDNATKAKVRSRLNTDLSRGKQKGLWKAGRKLGTYTSR